MKFTEQEVKRIKLWENGVRSRFNRNRLTDEQIWLLNKNDFDFSPQVGVWLSFEESKKFVHSLKLQSYSEWRKYCKSGKKPKNIPSWPVGVYHDKWIGWGDWLGTGRIADRLKVYRSFKQARKFSRGLKLKTMDEWMLFCKSGKLPNDIPKIPEHVYENKGWCGYGDWLGTGRIASGLREYLPYEEARKFIHSLNIRSKEEWFEWWSKNRPENIPASPRRYKKHWSGWRDYLGNTGVIRHRKNYIPFKEARKFARGLNLPNYKSWIEWCRKHKPKNIPWTPRTAYREEWISFNDWIGK